MLVKIVINTIRDNKKSIYSELNGMINVPMVSDVMNRIALRAFLML